MKKGRSDLRDFNFQLADSHWVRHSTRSTSRRFRSSRVTGQSISLSRRSSSILSSYAFRRGEIVRHFASFAREGESVRLLLDSPTVRGLLTLHSTSTIGSETAESSRELYERQLQEWFNATEKSRRRVSIERVELLDLVHS